MENHGLLFKRSFILDSKGCLIVPSDAQENGKTENTPCIIICWHTTPLQLIRGDALDERHHAALPLGGRTCRRWVTTLSTVFLGAQLVLMTMTDYDVLSSFVKLL